MKKNNPVKKIHFDYIQNQNGLYLHDDVPFTGYSLEFTENGELSKVRRFDMGKDRGENNKLFADISSRRVSANLIELRYDEESRKKRYYFDKEPFEGYSYLFDGFGNLIEENRFDSISHINRQWYSNGQKKIDRVNPDNQKSWYRNGQLKSNKIYQDGVLQYSSKYYRNGALYYLYIADCEEIPSKIFFYDNVSDWFVLSGEGVDDKLVEEWWVKKRHKISRLSLIKTKMTSKGISCMDTDYMIRLDLTDNKNILPNWVVEFESQKPNCTVVFNNKIVEHEPKLRIHMSGLDDSNNRFYFEDKLFSGIAYKIEEAKRIPRIVYFKDGEAVENSRDVLARNRQILRVNRRYLKENVPFVKMGRPRYILGNSGFRGVAYQFENNRLLAEELYDPDLSIYREWYPDGHIKLEKYKDLCYEWFVGGQLHRYVNGQLEEKFLRNGMLYWLKLDADDIVDPFYFEKFVLAKTVHLVGMGLDDSVLNTIFHGRQQNEVEELNVVSQNVSREACEKVKRSYPQIRVKRFI